MNPLLIYLLKVQICLIAGILLYECALRNDTFFRRNRSYLISILFVSFLLPFLPTAEVQSQFAFFDQSSPSISQATPIYLVVPDESGASYSLIRNEAQSFSIPWTQLWWGIYLFGIAIGIIRLVNQLHKILAMIQSGNRQRGENFVLVDFKQPISPFSFFRYIIWHSASHSPTEQTVILKHELAHIQGRHTLDVLLMELVKILFWFNPFVYLYRHRLRELHEFLADQSVCEQGKISSFDYGSMLVQQVKQRQNWFPLPSHFARQQMIRRLLMLNKAPTHPIQRFKFYMGIPLLALSMAIGYSIFPHDQVMSREKAHLYFVWPDPNPCNGPSERPESKAASMEAYFQDESGAPHPILDQYQVHLLSHEERDLMKPNTWLETDGSSWISVELEQGKRQTLPLRERYTACLLEPPSESLHLISHKPSDTVAQSFTAYHWNQWLHALVDAESQDVWIDLAKFRQPHNIVIDSVCRSQTIWEVPDPIILGKNGACGN